MAVDFRRKGNYGKIVMQNDLTEKISKRGKVSPISFADSALKISAKSWFITAVIGQVFFLTYLLGFYGRAVFQGDLEVLNKVMPKGYIAGDTFGNLAVVIHILFAIIIIGGGIMQVTPQIRERFPTFHRWTGRIYIPVAFIMAIGGLYMVWVRGAVGDFSQHFGISLNAVLIMTCAVMTLRTALARKFAIHRQWALRLFIVSSGVWFFRVGLMFWVFVNGGVAGFDEETFTGPFLTFWATADSLLPLEILELYLRSPKFNIAGRLAVSAILVIATIVIAIGSFIALLGLWLPRIT
jgi:hypothetical protein